MSNAYDTCSSFKDKVLRVGHGAGGAFMVSAVFSTLQFLSKSRDGVFVPHLQRTARIFLASKSTCEHVRHLYQTRFG